MLCLLLATTAFGASVADNISAAKQAIIDKKYPQANTLLIEAEGLAPFSSAPLDSSEIASIFFYKGIVLQLQGDESALSMWRSALIIEPSFNWDDSVIKDEVAQDIFLAIQGEVQSRPTIDVGVPEKYGKAKLYVDGTQRVPTDRVPEGIHLAQIKCPKGEVFGKWTEFDRRFKWLKMCPYTFDVNEEPDEEVEDEWAAFGPAFGPSVPPPPESSQPITSELPPSVWEEIDKTNLYIAGGLAVVSASLYKMALNGRAEFDDISNKNVTTLEDLEALQKSTNNKVYLSASMGGAAAGLYAAALWKVKF
jgi:hypothetical protein